MEGDLHQIFRDMGRLTVGLILIYLLVVADLQLPGAAHHHGADPADHHRRHARPRPARRAIHGDIDDRHDRAGRHHRPQLHPARRFHQQQVASGMNFHDAVIQSAAVRAKPLP